MNYRERLKDKKRIVIKIGSSSLTHSETGRLNLRAQLDNVDVQQEDGTIINLGEKYGIKKRH